MYSLGCNDILSDSESVRSVIVQDLCSTGDLRTSSELFTIVFIWSGELSCKVSEERFCLSAGCFLVVSPRQEIRFQGTSSSCFSIIRYDSASFADIVRVEDSIPLFSLFFEDVSGGRSARCERFVLEVEARELSELRTEIDDLLQEQCKTVTSSFYSRMTFLRFLYRCIQHVDLTTMQNAKKAPTDVRYLLNAVERALHDRVPFDLKSAALQVGYSSRHIARRFRQFTGITPKGFLQKRRIQLAAMLLLDARRRITDVAYELGFSDGPHFTRVFREEKGVSPRAFRKNHLGIQADLDG